MFNLLGCFCFLVFGTYYVISIIFMISDRKKENMYIENEKRFIKNLCDELEERFYK